MEILFPFPIAYIERKQKKKKKKHVKLIYIPSAEISSFIKICGLWFVNISYFPSRRIDACFSSNIFFRNNSLHTINVVAMS